MKKALQEAELAFEKGEIPVGALIVVDNKIIARTHNLTELLNDVTAHAEMQAITSAANFLGGKYLTGCTLYVTLEPCQMCAGALYWSQIGKIVFGASDIKRGFKKVNEELIHKKTDLVYGILEDEFNLLQTQVGKLDCLVAGHTGIPMIRDFNKKKWLNSGAIGLPSNDGNIDTNFLTITTKNIKINKLEYDINAAYQAMQATSLIQGYHNTLRTGYWPSQETLPVSMRV